MAKGKNRNKQTTNAPQNPKPGNEIQDDPAIVSDGQVSTDPDETSEETQIEEQTTLSTGVRDSVRGELAEGEGGIQGSDREIDETPSLHLAGTEESQAAVGRVLPSELEARPPIIINSAPAHIQLGVNDIEYFDTRQYLPIYRPGDITAGGGVYVDGLLQRSRNTEPSLNQLATAMTTTPENTSPERDEQSIAPTDVGNLNDLLGAAPVVPVDSVQLDETPVVEAAPEPKFSFGAVVDQSQGFVGKAAPVAFQNAIATERTDQQVDTRSPWEHRIAAYMDGAGHKRERYVATALEGYVQDMAINGSIDEAKAVQRQKNLWRTLKNVVSNEDGFDVAVTLVIDYFRQHKDTVFNGRYIHRYVDKLDLSRDEMRGLEQLCSIFMTAAGVNTRADVLKHCALQTVELKGMDEIVRERLYNYFKFG